MYCLYCKLLACDPNMFKHPPLPLTRGAVSPHPTRVAIEAAPPMSSSFFVPGQKIVALLLKPMSESTALLLESCVCVQLLPLDAKNWGSGLPQNSRPVHRAAFQRGVTGAVASPHMSLMLLAEEEVPISPEQQESIISVLSVASSALLLVIVGGAGEQRAQRSWECEML